GNQYNNYSDAMYFIRPDVVELINISGRAISLRDWHVVVNTGVEAVDLSTIDSARYSHPTLGRYDDPNPSIAANGYFYLTNNREIFGLDYGDGSGDYGSNRKEVNPVCEIPDQNWGIKYKITSVDHSDNITVDGADWRPDQLLGELVEYVSNRQPSNRDAPNGVIKNITSNTRKSINVAGQDPFGSGLIAGDYIRIKGLPRQGCFASFTLKNEYRQVTARTTEYGSLTEEQFGRSTEKYDPTHYNWVISSRPTISGDPKFSRNNSLPGGTIIPAHVKDNNFVSVGEIQQVRKPSDWENIGMKGRGKSSVNTLKAIARYFTVSGIRLDPEEQGAHISGWRPAFGKATTASANKNFRSNCSWEPNIWAGQTLRLMSGVLNGEKYFITNSTQSGVTVAGYSTQSGKQLQVNPGDRFSVGPGYATPMFYCRQNGEAGVWEWPNKGIEPMSYGLYLSGLNDAIITTEFLEENHNAELRIEVFNYQTEAFEQLPLARDNYSTSAAEDVYKMVRSHGLMQYDKNDNMYCGMIHAEHISANGGIRLRITPSSLNDKLGSGFAWFDYAVLTPGNTLGKININTASERILASMPGVTPELAANITRGLDSVGRPTLKPFRNITDILDVRGMMPDVFSTIANLITTRSDQFRVQVIAQALDCSAPDGVYDPQRGDRVTAQTHNDIVVDRGQLTDDNPANNGFLFLPSK
ncbi:MAG: helix-hairpin-helix domain-containing protein, partial [bacterium]|nr:helix-hairpin-helix domain-containing protein [bacterium]